MSDIYIKQQLAMHPSVQPQDVLKMCFQAAFGAEHLITDMERVENYFTTEYEKTASSNKEQMIEYLSPTVARLNIASWKHSNMPPAWLFDLFVAGVSFDKGDKAEKSKLFYDYITAWTNYIYANEKNMTFTLAQFEEVLRWYIEKCEGTLQAVHHSQDYRDGESPAYRVISGPAVDAFTILEAAYEKCGSSGGVIIIDGKAGAGKTTVAGVLSAVLNTPTICMDHFFLPPALRSADRLDAPGGNIDHQRFIAEVMPNLSAAFQYNIFDCSIMALKGTRSIPAGKWQIIEGSYSHHPELQYGDNALKVFVDIPYDTQIARLEKRNPKLLQRFVDAWIPMEEKYFAAFDVKDNADITI